MVDRKGASSGVQVREHQGQRLIHRRKQFLGLLCDPRTLLQDIPQLRVVGPQLICHLGKIRSPGADVVDRRRLRLQQRRRLLDELDDGIRVLVRVTHEQGHRVQQSLQVLTRAVECVEGLVHHPPQLCVLDPFEQPVGLVEQRADLDGDRTALDHGTVLQIAGRLDARLRHELEVLLADRRDTVHRCGGVVGDLGVRVDREFCCHTLFGQGHRLHLAHVDPAVADVAVLVETAGTGQLHLDVVFADADHAGHPDVEHGDGDDGQSRHDREDDQLHADKRCDPHGPSSPVGD